MTTKLDDTSWQREFLEMKSHSLADIKLLTDGAKGLKIIMFKLLRLLKYLKVIQDILSKLKIRNLLKLFQISCFLFY